MRYTVKQMRQQFPDDDSCLEVIFASRYSEMKACPKCGVVGAKYYRVKNRKSYVCKECRHQIFPLVGTIFEKSTTPLTDWFHCLYLFSVSKNGVSAKEIERQIGVSYVTAHRMAKMIRLLMAEHGMLGASGEPVEQDEVYIGGKRKLQFKNRKKPVLAALEVGGHIRTAVVDKANSETAVKFLGDNVFYGSKLHTDESKIYKADGVTQYYKHESIRHIGHEWVRNGVTTNHVEGFFSQLKSSLRGTYHSVSTIYLGSYVSEFAYRYNHRNELIFPLLLAKAVKRF